MSAVARFFPLLLLVQVLATPIVGVAPLRVPLSATLALWLVAVIGRTGRTERAFLAGAAVSALAVWGLLDLPARTLIEALDRATQFVALMVALGLLRDAAHRSKMVRDCGAWLVAQKPAWRFLAIAAGGHGFGIALNMGAVLLLGTLIKRANTLDAAGGDADVVAIREERMNAALLQGFFIMLLWSPMAISVAFTLALIPGITWFDVGPTALGLAVIFFALAWVMDRLKWPPSRRRAPPREGPSPPVTQALPMIVLILALVGMVLGTKAALHYGMIDAIITVASVFGVVWLYAQYHGRTSRPAAAWRLRLRRHAAELVPEMRPEAIVLASASFLAVTLAALGQQLGLSALLDLLRAPAWLLSVGIVIFVIVGSQLGIVAMVTTAVAGAAVLGMRAAPLGAVELAISLQVGWALSAVLSAYSGGSMLLARIAHVDPSVFRRWNLPWASACLGIFAVFAYLFF
jgi:hypothetical protein